MISQTLPSALEKEGWDIKTFKNKLLVIDVEGHELEVLKGCPSDFLKNFDYIMCEVSKIERHINAPVFEEVSAFLKIAGFSIDFEGPREFFDDVLYRRN
jgi:hypothetical protein